MGSDVGLDVGPGVDFDEPPSAGLGLGSYLVRRPGEPLMRSITSQVCHRVWAVVHSRVLGLARHRVQDRAWELGLYWVWDRVWDQVWRVTWRLR